MEASLVYIMCSRPVRTTYQVLALKKKIYATKKSKMLVKHSRFMGKIKQHRRIATEMELNTRPCVLYKR